MNKFKKFSALERATVAFMVAACCTHPATAGNKTMVPPSGIGKAEASISYPTSGVTTTNEAKQPFPDGVLSTTSVTNPAAGVFKVPTTGFPTTGNLTTNNLPTGTPSTVYCTVTSVNYVGGYK